MLRRYLWLIVSLLLLATAATAFLVLRRPSSQMEVARKALLESQHEIALELIIDVSKGSDADDPEHQELSAEGIVDLDKQQGVLTYDFQGLNNAGGFLGHFEEMEMILSASAIYADVFVDGPPWVRIVPDDIGVGEVDRLRDMLLTTPLVLPSLLEVEASAEQLSDEAITRTVSTASLASAEGFTGAVGSALADWDVAAVRVEVALMDGTPQRFVLSFSYAPGSDDRPIDVVATYELSSEATLPDAPIPPQDETTDYAEIFGSS